MGDIAPRWLSREDAAEYIGVKEHQLPRLVRAGKIPPPSVHLGPRNPRYDRDALDRAFGIGAASSHEKIMEDAINAIARRGRARRSAHTG